MNLSVAEAVSLLINHPAALLIFVLGTFGWWRLIAIDSVFDKPRDWFWHKFPYEGYQVEGEENKPESGESIYAGGVWYVTKGRWVSELIRCPWCLGWWVALVQFITLMVNPSFALALATLHAARIVAAFCHQKLD